MLDRALVAKESHSNGAHGGRKRPRADNNGQKKAGDDFPGVQEERRTNYRLILRRKNPPSPITPVPIRNSDDGSGTTGL